MVRRRSGSAGGPPASAHRGWYGRGYLPHCDPGDVTQMITYRLADALPRELVRAKLRGVAERSVRRAATDQLLDAGYGSGLLRQPAVARCVIENWRRFDRQRYRLHAWVVMPSHVHLVIDVVQGHPLSEIIHSWKSYTSHEIRRWTGCGGRIWQPEYWDRFIRDDLHFVRAVDYIDQNPVRAGLAPSAGLWPWSSASTEEAGGPPALPGAR